MKAETVTPRRLRRLAARAGKPAEAYLRDVLLAHDTDGAAADALGVSPRTLYAWKRKLGIEV